MSEEKKFKFDVVIGNPPFQEEVEGTSATQIYPYFMNEAYKISDISEFITKAGFLFNAGKTSKAWNKKMLSDPHVKVLFYEEDASKVFPTVGFKGGVAVTYRSLKETFEPIGVFTKYTILNTILKKVKKLSYAHYLSELGASQNSFKFTNKLYEDYPELENVQSKGHKYDLKSNVFDKLNKIFDQKENDESVGIWGRYNNSRICMYTKRKYLKNDYNIDFYKVVLPKAYGKGELGEVITDPFIVGPNVGLTETFISFGKFVEEKNAKNLLKYLKTKFLRAILSSSKVTQDNTVAKYNNVPLQDFTSNSDIDWSKSIPEIDQQLYKKYNLSPEEIDFIETHVKEMD